MIIIKGVMINNILFFILIQMKDTIDYSERTFQYYLELIRDWKTYSSLAKIYVAFTSDERLTSKEIEILELIYQFKLKTLD